MWEFLEGKNHVEQLSFSTSSQITNRNWGNGVILISGSSWHSKIFFAYRLLLESGCADIINRSRKMLPSWSTDRLLKSTQGIFLGPTYIEVEKGWEVDSRSSRKSRSKLSSQKDRCQSTHFTANIHREVARSFESWIARVQVYKWHLVLQIQGSGKAQLEPRTTQTSRVIEYDTTKLQNGNV